jgi:DNA-binding MarR family transcriptional regulator
MDHIDKILNQWSREKPELEIRAMGLIGRIKRLSHLLELEMEKVHGEFGLNLASFDVLATLRRSGSSFTLSPGDLLSSSMVTSGTMTNRIDQLVKAGFVVRVQNPDDGRSVLVSLTKKGLKVIDAVVEEHVQIQSRLVEGLSESQFDRLNRLLSTYLVMVENQVRD